VTTTGSRDECRLENALKYVDRELLLLVKNDGAVKKEPVDSEGARDSGRLMIENRLKKVFSFKTESWSNATLPRGVLSEIGEEASDALLDS
jgi:hypothetical protein